MTLAQFRVRAGKALRMSPRQLAVRLTQEIRQQTKRPWTSVYPRVLSNVAILGDGGAASLEELWPLLARTGAFFMRPADREAWTAAFRERFPDDRIRVIAAAETALRHEFDLLGSGPVLLGTRLPWHSDFKTGRVWPLAYAADIEYLELDRDSDVKVPWELSRAQHFTTLGQAYWLTGDERFAREIVDQIDDWIAANPFGYGVNWAIAMDVALRAVSWIWGFYFIAESDACRDGAFRARVLRSLFMHGEFIARNLETSDINGNHYLSDAAGLVFLGAFFRHTTAGRAWLALGRRIVSDETFAQVFPDGVNHEGSTAYHRLVFELFLTSYLLLERAGESVPSAGWDRLARMADYVAAYTKPNGQTPLVGDADDGRVQKLGGQDINDHRYLLSTAAVRFQRADFKSAAGRFWEESFWLLGPAGAATFDCLADSASPAASAAFPDSGYFVLRNPSCHVFIDGAEVGMRGRGGHGHNDCLSFELFMDGANVVSDCGTLTYTASREWRNRFRSTAFHNTIQIDEEEVNRLVEPNALWQLRNDAVPVDVRWRFDQHGSYWQGSHTGYERLPQPCRPLRQIWLHGQEPLIGVRDQVNGSGRHRLIWRWHLDPACRATVDDGDARIQTAAGTSWMLRGPDSPIALEVEEGWVSRSYGVKVPAPVIVASTESAVPLSVFYVFAAERLNQVARAGVLSQLIAAAAES